MSRDLGYDFLKTHALINMKGAKYETARWKPKVVLRTTREGLSVRAEVLVWVVGCSRGQCSTGTARHGRKVVGSQAAAHEGIVTPKDHNSAGKRSGTVTYLVSDFYKHPIRYNQGSSTK
jgi:hypothetical protein